MTPPALNIELPEWVPALAPADACSPDPGARMGLAIALAEANVAHGGGPFGAVVTERGSGRLVAAGVNLVLATNASIAHAEVVALTLAQRRLASYDLAREPDWDFELVTSAEPCIQCFGAVIWSGIRSLICGARSEDAEAAGFDEGPKPPAWEEELRARGIGVARNLRREEAARVIREYAAAGGPVYNPGSFR